MTEEKPIIAVLGGTGKEGPGLAIRWAAAGYKVIIGSRRLEKAVKKAKELNKALGIDTITGLENENAARKADISVLTIVQSAHQSALMGLKEALKGKVLVDATARVEFGNPKPPLPPAAAEIAQEFLGPDVKVVAAFQNVPAHALRNIHDPITSEVLVCANDLTAALQVIQLAEAAGMKAYYSGELANAVTVEGLTAVLINLNKHYKSRTASIRITGI